LFAGAIILVAVALIAAQGAASLVVAGVGAFALISYMGFIYNAWASVVVLIVLGVIIAYKSAR